MLIGGMGSSPFETRIMLDISLCKHFGNFFSSTLLKSFLYLNNIRNSRYDIIHFIVF